MAAPAADLSRSTGLLSRAPASDCVCDSQNKLPLPVQVHARVTRAAEIVKHRNWYRSQESHWEDRGNCRTGAGFRILTAHQIARQPAATSNASSGRSPAWMPCVAVNDSNTTPLGMASTTTSPIASTTNTKARILRCVARREGFFIRLKRSETGKIVIGEALAWSSPGPGSDLRPG
jgi:hypothetical protein